MKRVSANPLIPARVAHRVLVYFALIAAALYVFRLNAVLFPLGVIALAIAGLLGFGRWRSGRA